MHTMNLTIEDDVFPQLKAFLAPFVKDKKVWIIESELPANVIVSSVEELHRRVAEAEKRITNGEYYTEEEFWEQVETHLDKQ